MQNHKIQQCFQLERKSYDEKVSFVMDNRLCFGFLRKGHNSRSCTDRATCKKCNKAHPTSPHNTERKVLGFRQPQGAVNKGNTSSKTDEIPATPSKVTELNVKTTQLNQGALSMAIPVYISVGNNAEKLVYALLDTQSEACFISKEVADVLRPPYEVERVTMCTLNGRTTSDMNKY